MWSLAKHNVRHVHGVCGRYKRVRLLSWVLCCRGGLYQRDRQLWVSVYCWVYRRRHPLYWSVLAQCSLIIIIIIIIISCYHYVHILYIMCYQHRFVAAFRRHLFAMQQLIPSCCCSSCCWEFLQSTVLGSDRRFGSDRRSEPNPNPIPTPNPNPSRFEPINFSFNSLLSFRSPIWTYNYPSSKSRSNAPSDRSVWWPLTCSKNHRKVFGQTILILKTSIQHLKRYWTIFKNPGIQLLVQIELLT